VLDFNDGNGVNFKWKVLVEQNAHSIITYDYNIYCNIMLYIYICIYIYTPVSYAVFRDHQKISDWLHVPMENPE
jgi:hypothetical protein